MHSSIYSTTQEQIYFSSIANLEHENPFHRIYSYFIKLGVDFFLKLDRIILVLALKRSEC